MMSDKKPAPMKNMVERNKKTLRDCLKGVELSSEAGKAIARYFSKENQNPWIDIRLNPETDGEYLLRLSVNGKVLHQTAFYEKYKWDITPSVNILFASHYMPIPKLP